MRCSAPKYVMLTSISGPLNKPLDNHGNHKKNHGRPQCVAYGRLPIWQIPSCTLIIGLGCGVPRLSGGGIVGITVDEGCSPACCTLGKHTGCAWCRVAKHTHTHYTESLTSGNERVKHLMMLLLNDQHGRFDCQASTNLFIISLKPATMCSTLHSYSCLHWSCLKVAQNFLVQMQSVQRHEGCKFEPTCGHFVRGTENALIRIINSELRRFTETTKHYRDVHPPQPHRRSSLLRGCPFVT